MESIWKEKLEATEYQVLKGNISTDAAVIGGGMAGILIAWHLQREGVKTVLLEADRIGSGQTGSTTAKITSQHGLIYEKLLGALGADKAAQYAAANRRAVDDFEKVVKDEKISCHFKRISSYLFTAERKEELHKEYQAAIQLGLNAELFTEPYLPFSLPFPIVSMLEFKEQAQFHPLEFLYALAERLEIYEKTAVIQVKEHRLETDQGSVDAKYIIFASHYPFVNAPGFYFTRMHQERSYIVALKRASLPEGMYYGIDEKTLSFRTYEGSTLLGGESHRTGEHKEQTAYDTLINKAKEIWPDCLVTGKWSAQDCITIDGIPYIGQYSQARPYWYVATGFHKWGMSSSMAAAVIIRDMITGRENRTSEIFAPKRFYSALSVHSLFDEMNHAAGGITRGYLARGQMELDEIPIGIGKMITYEGMKMGAYKEENGAVYLVKPQCPHLGCELSWNQEELSWDCPCHGSRFTYQGELIDNPAQKDLIVIKKQI